MNKLIFFIKLPYQFPLFRRTLMKLTMNATVDKADVMIIPDDLNIFPTFPDDKATCKGCTIKAIKMIMVSKTAKWAGTFASFFTPLESDSNINPKNTGIRAVKDPPTE